MTIIAVLSSAIKGVEYHGKEGQDKAQLDVYFKDGKNRKYVDVPPQTVEEFLKAESAGKFFNQNIRDSFKNYPIEQDIP